MSTVIYDEPWSPSKINCDWKPKRLARYSLVGNMIDYNAPGVKLGFKQIESEMEEDGHYNLTDYIAINIDGNYEYVAKDVDSRDYFVCVAFFDSNKNFISSITRQGDDRESIRRDLFMLPSDCRYIRLSIPNDYNRGGWGNGVLGYFPFTETELDKIKQLPFSSKETTPLNIVDNKKNQKIYEDLYFEVYVKAEALTKNFVDIFDLSAFQEYEDGGNNNNNIYLEPKNSSYYTTGFPAFIPNHYYEYGDRTHGSYAGTDYYLVCLHDHVSQPSFAEEIWGVLDYWFKIPDSWQVGTWLSVDRNIKESNYDLNSGFPYVGSILFKNLWGCDRTDYLNTYVNSAYLRIFFRKLFSYSNRDLNPYQNKFFERGYFDDAFYGNGEEKGVRFIRGESFRQDEIIGDLVADGYFDFTETYVPLSQNLRANFVADHVYNFKPKDGIPFFKKKIFEDCQIQLNLNRKDRLGNIFKRIVNLPILVTFYNNLIKVYWQINNNQFYEYEFLNSNVEHNFRAHVNTRTTSYFKIWCPDTNRLTISSTLLGDNSYTTTYDPESFKNGQICTVDWEFISTKVGSVIRGIHVIEYNDGLNYDKFIYKEVITIVE